MKKEIQNDRTQAANRTGVSNHRTHNTPENTQQIRQLRIESRAKNNSIVKLLKAKQKLDSALKTLVGLIDSKELRVKSGDALLLPSENRLMLLDILAETTPHMYATGQGDAYHDYAISCLTTRMDPVAKKLAQLAREGSHSALKHIWQLGRLFAEVVHDVTLMRFATQRYG